VDALACLVTHTCEQVPLDEYVEGLRTRIQTLVGDNRLLSTAQKRALKEHAAALSAHIRRLSSAVGGQIATALTHGDFQPANVLVDGERVWLIDWEYAARRQAGYDALVYGLRARFPRGLAHRLDEFVAQGPEADRWHTRWPRCGWQGADDRFLYAVLFWLEELSLHLEENANPSFVQPGEGLPILMGEIDLWIKARRNADG
jgi:hypothetical protein